MSPTWYGEPPAATARLGVTEWARIVARGLPVLIVLAFGLLCMAVLRVVERPIYGASRPMSPQITVQVCRVVLRLLGIKRRAEGDAARGPGVVVANHASWLDIFALNAQGPLTFVSKAEVAGWPGIGLLARVTGTVFIARDRTKVAEQNRLLRDKLASGHRLVIFPEGTSTDNNQVLRFRSALFGAFAAQEVFSVQPVSLRYSAPPGRDTRFFAWWGDMDFGPHLLQVLAAPCGGRVTLVYHPPLPCNGAMDRKALAAACESAVRAGHAQIAT